MLLAPQLMIILYKTFQYLTIIVISWWANSTCLCFIFFIFFWLNNIYMYCRLCYSKKYSKNKGLAGSISSAIYYNNICNMNTHVVCTCNNVKCWWWFWWLYHCLWCDIYTIQKSIIFIMVWVSWKTSHEWLKPKKNLLKTFGGFLSCHHVDRGKRPHHVRECISHTHA